MQGAGGEKIEKFHSLIQLTNIYAMGFPGGSGSKESVYQGRRHKRCGFDPWVGKIPWRRHGNPLQYSCLENRRDRGAW